MVRRKRSQVCSFGGLTSRHEWILSIQGEMQRTSLGDLGPYYAARKSVTL